MHDSLASVLPANGHAELAGVRALLSWAPECGVTRIELEVIENNLGAIRLYERLGFEHEGSRRGAVIVEGEPLDILRTARILSA